MTVAKEGILGQFTTEKAARRYEQDGQYGPKAGFEEWWLDMMLGQESNWYDRIERLALKANLTINGINTQSIRFGMVSSVKWCTTFEILIAQYRILETEYDRALRAFLESGKNQLMSTKQFCKVALNLDIIRGLEIDSVSSTEELDKKIYKCTIKMKSSRRI